MLHKRLEEQLETWDLPQECERHHMSGNLVRMKIKCIDKLDWNKLGHFLTNFWGDLCPYKACTVSRLLFSTRLYCVCQICTSFFMSNLNLELAIGNSHYSSKNESKAHYTINVSTHSVCRCYVSVVTLRLIGICLH